MTVFTTWVQHCLWLLSQRECNDVYNCYQNVSATLFMTVITTWVQHCLWLLWQRECKTVWLLLQRECNIDNDFYLNMSHYLWFLLQRECNIAYNYYQSNRATLFMTSVYYLNVIVSATLILIVITIWVQHWILTIFRRECNIVNAYYLNVSETLFITVI